MKHGKLMSAVLSAALVAGLLGGCGKDDTGKTDLPSQETGKYVEEEQELSGEWDGWTAVQVFAVDGKVHLLMTKEEEDNLRLRECEQQGDIFVDVTENWLGMVELPSQGYMQQLKLMRDGNGVQYLFAEYVVGNC